jgi:hypothetical protein
VAPATVKRLVRRVGTNGEVHETPILTTYRRARNVEEYEDEDELYPSSLSNFSSSISTLFSFNAC